MRSILRYVWAAPASLVGVLLSLPALAMGATARVHDGVLEVGGGLLSRAMRRVGRCSGAITFGHVVLGTSHRVLACLRVHEHAHVRQYEQCGVLFFPLYLGSSLLELLRGRCPYRDNAFERGARAVEQGLGARG